MFVIIAGAGRTGRALAAALAARGHRVVLLDKRPDAAERAGTLPGVTVIAADAASPTGLRQADAGHAHTVVTVMGDDQTNLIAATLARREFGVPHVLAQVHDPAHTWLYSQALGVDVVLEDAEMLAHLVDEDFTPAELRSLARLRRAGYGLLEVPLPADSGAAGRPLADLALPADCTLAAIFRAEQTLNPRPDLALAAGDVLLVVARLTQAAALTAALGPRMAPPPPPIEVLHPTEETPRETDTETGNQSSTEAN